MSCIKSNKSWLRMKRFDLQLINNIHLRYKETPRQEVRMNENRDVTSFLVSCLNQALRSSKSSIMHFILFKQMTHPDNLPKWCKTRRLQMLDTFNHTLVPFQKPLIWLKKFQSETTREWSKRKFHYSWGNFESLKRPQNKRIWHFLSKNFHHFEFWGSEIAQNTIFLFDTNDRKWPFFKWKYKKMTIHDILWA